MVSIIIASRVDEFLQRTIDDLLAKAEGEVEVIVVLDGYWPDPIIKDDPRVILLHQGELHNNFGMRVAINAGVRLSRGQYIMKVDEHVMMSKGYDTRLTSICKDDWVIIPRRKRLDAENWSIIDDGRVDVCYMYVDYPFKRPFDKTCGLYGAEWKERYFERKDILVDDTPTMQGSCYFLKKSYWDKLLPNGMDEKNYGPFNHEAQEISMAAWLSGGRVVVDKESYYCHFHKGKKGKGYSFSTEQYKRFAEWKERARLFAIDYWLHTQDFKYDFKWFINEKFPNTPNWPKDWEQRIITDKEKDYSTLKYKDDYWLSGLRQE